MTDDDFLEVMKTDQIDAIQIRYNPKRTQAADRIIPLAHDMNIAILVMQPLRWGVMMASPAASELRELGVSNWGEAILRWIFTNDAISTVLTATNTPGRMAANAAIAQLLPLDNSQISLISHILARGKTEAVPQPGMTSCMAEGPVMIYLEERLGASFCDRCIASQFSVAVEAVTALRQRLPPDRFANEVAPCLTCGETSFTMRSRTIMR